MILSLHTQAQLFLLTVLIGGGMGVFYDVLRIFRHALPHKVFWIQLEDGIFWLLAVFSVFGMMLRASGGEIRFFVILGLFGGMGLYMLVLSPWVISASNRIIALLRYLINLFFRIILTPFRLIWLPLRRPVLKFRMFCGNKRKKLLHSLKVCVRIKLYRLRIGCHMIWRRKK